MKSPNKTEENNLLKVILFIAILNLIVNLITQAFFAYGIFRDELYYLACANRIQLGYVDHPPLSIYILAVWKAIFSDSLFAIRTVPAIISSATVFMIGLFTLRLGGGKSAIIISTISFMLTPIFLGMNTIYSMNAFDFFFWITSAYVFLRIIQQKHISGSHGNAKLWIILGIVLGLGLLNKTSVFWLGAGIFAGMIFTPLRKYFKTTYPYITAIIALLIFSPFIIWNLTHDLAHIEFMRNASVWKYSGLTPLTFIHDQIFTLNPVSIFIWLPGIILLFFRKEFKQYRPIGFIWLTTFLILVANVHSKGEYIAAAYQILFAAGAVLIERWSTLPKRFWVKYSIMAPILLSGILISPLARPVLAPDKFIKYQSAMGLEPPSNEGKQLEKLPQFYADMFGWEDLAQNVSKIYLSLSVDERKTTVIYCNNYGEAGAIEYYSKKYPLPQVICPHNNYWYWPNAKEEPAIVIIIGGKLQDHLESLEQVENAGLHKSKYAIPYENNLSIYIGRRLKRSISEIKESNKIFI